MSCPKIMTASRFNAYTACQRKHFYRYEDGYDSDVRSEPLLVGSALHKGMEVWWDSKKFEDDEGDIQGATQALNAEIKLLELKKHCGPFTIALVEEMFEGYCGKYCNDKITAFTVESKFQVPLINPRTQKQHNGWQISGKIDAVVYDHATKSSYLMDHKSASQDVAPGATYWEKLKFDKQISMYFLGVKALGYENIQGFIYDVLKKPYVKRKLMTPKHKQKFKRNGLPYSWVNERDETVSEYRDRVKADIQKNFDKYYRREVVLRTDEQLEAFQWDLVRVADLIDGEATREDALQNCGACSMYGKVCPYLQVCTKSSKLDQCEGLTLIKPFIELEEE